MEVAVLVPADKTGASTVERFHVEVYAKISYESFYHLSTD